MGTLVVDDITDPSNPTKRRFDVLLKMCRMMMREKDQEIRLLREQVERLTKKNVQLQNALTDRKRKIMMEDVEDSGRVISISVNEPQMKNGELKNVKRKTIVPNGSHKEISESKIVGTTFPRPKKLKIKSSDKETGVFLDEESIGDKSNDGNNTNTQTVQENGPKDNACDNDLQDIDGAVIEPLSAGQTCGVDNPSRTSLAVNEGDDLDSFWTVTKHNGGDITEDIASNGLYIIVVSDSNG
ncbi:uncharacterized protein LOC113510031 [Galleria mellonella]|uniref:Uncharacterized protein LOC113510031 n=1 Tax=Galleria mellonella TaxID=7137 RepID=A0A6J1W8R3_GALME|nr:uncharacterized protein LOC113510031 [Galleria mellonella]